MAEPLIAPFLTELAARVKVEGIKVGSYPTYPKGVTVSLLGQDVDLVKKIGEEVCPDSYVMYSGISLSLLAPTLLSRVMITHPQLARLYAKLKALSLTRTQKNLTRKPFRHCRAAGCIQSIVFPPTSIRR